MDVSSQAENRGLRALCRNTVYSGAGTGECHNSIHIKLGSKLYGGMRYGGRNRIMLIPDARDTVIPVLSGIGRNTAHRVNSNNRIVAYSRFIRCHSCICTVEHRISAVGCLSTCRYRAVDHGTEDFSSDDNRLAVVAGKLNAALRDQRYLFKRHLHSHIAAGNHDTVECLDDLF